VSQTQTHLQVRERSETVWATYEHEHMQQHGRLINILTLNFLSPECFGVVRTVCMCVWEDYLTDPVL